MLRVTSTGSPNAVLSGLFFGPASPPPSSNTASFVGTDTTTQGNWVGVYGRDGYGMVNDAFSYPAYAQVTPTGALTYTWASTTTDVRALQHANGVGRIAATWYSSTTFSIDLNLTDGGTHQVAIYALDWDATTRAEQLDILDSASGVVLDTRSLTGFRNGQYVIWNLKGHVLLRVTCTGNPNAVLSGLFFGPTSPPPSSNTASFVGADVTTQGNWVGVYGRDGYGMVNDAFNYPAYAQVTPTGALTYTWASATTDVRALQHANGVGRIAATWYSSTTFSIDLNLTDGATHQVAIYAVDWDTTTRAERLDILDSGSGATLDSRSLAAFRNGQYVIWNLKGHVVLRVTNTTSNAVLSGLFFR